MILKNQLLLEGGIPSSRSDRIYPMSVLEDIEKQNANNKVMGTVGNNRFIDGAGTINDIDICLQSTNIHIVGKDLRCDVEIFENTKFGRFLSNILPSLKSDDYFFSVAGTGKLSDDQLVASFSLQYINIILNGARHL